MHSAPLHGKPRPVGEAILAQLFPGDSSGRIPVFVITGDGERQANAQNLDRLLTATKRVAGRADRGGLYVASKRIAPAHSTDFQNAQAVLLHPEVEVAVIEADGREVAELGLGCSRADVAIVTSRNQDEIESIDQQAGQRISAIAAVHAVPPDGVALLPWNDWARTVLAPACRGKVFYYDFSEHSDSVDCENGVFWLRGKEVVLSRKGSVTTVPFSDMQVDLRVDSTLMDSTLMDSTLMDSTLMDLTLMDLTQAPDLFLSSLCGFWLSGLAQQPLQAPKM
jgi:hypothetical protein